MSEFEEERQLRIGKEYLHKKLRMKLNDLK